MRWAPLIALVGGLGMLAATATAKDWAGGCTAAGTWSQNTPGIAATTWTITSDGKARETGGPGSLPSSANGISASGTGTIAGQTLTITFVSWDTVTTGVLTWTLAPDCRSGQGTLTLTGPSTRSDIGKPYPSTVTGTGPPTTTTTTPTTTSTDPCRNSHSGRRLSGADGARAVNEVRVIAVKPDVQAHKQGTPEDAWITVRRDTVLQQGDEISIDPDGAATLQFADESTTVVRNTTQLKIASYFTCGGVVKTEILLKMGEIAAKVHKSEATKSDFRIKSPTGTASTRASARHGRGTARANVTSATTPVSSSFSVFRDPVTNTDIWSVTAGELDIAPSGGRSKIVLHAGQEVQITAKAVSKVAPIGKAGARGGINVAKARDLVMKQIAAKNGPCRLVLPRAGAYSVRPTAAGWLVSVKATAGKVKGWSTWNVAGKQVTPLNAAAKKISRNCR